MATIGIYNDLCIYREFLDLDTYLIIVLHSDTKILYQRKLTRAEWESINPYFTLAELESVFAACISKADGYNITVNHNDENTLFLVFQCDELIKNYHWEIECIEKNAYMNMEINSLFTKFNIGIRNYGNDVPYQLLVPTLSDLENQIKSTICDFKKEVAIISYIYDYVQKKMMNNMLSNKLTDIMEKSMPNKMDNSEPNSSGRITVLTKTTRTIRTTNDNNDDDYLSDATHEISDESNDESDDEFDDESDDDDSENESDRSTRSTCDLATRSIKNDLIQTSKPKEYQLFIASEMKRQREKNPGLSNSKYMTLAAAEWNKYKQQNNILTPKPKSDYQSFISQEIKRQRDKNPGLSNSKYMMLAAAEWNKYKQQNNILPIPKSEYQSFIPKEIKKQRENNPGLSNREYMTLAAAAWNKYKQRDNVELSDSSDNDTQSDSESDSDDDNLVAKGITNPPNAEKPRPAYQLFIQKELHRQREKQPGLANHQYMKLAAEEWTKYKKENGIVTGK